MALKKDTLVVNDICLQIGLALRCKAPEFRASCCPIVLDDDVPAFNMVRYLCNSMHYSCIFMILSFIAEEYLARLSYEDILLLRLDRYWLMLAWEAGRDVPNRGTESTAPTRNGY